jgi:hypothetical protein
VAGVAGRKASGKMRRRISPINSGSLRDAAGLVTLWSWIGVRVVLDAVRKVIDRAAASTLSTVVGSDPIDPDALEWTLRNVVDGGA